MKKLLFTFILALTSVLALNAESYSGKIYVFRHGQTYNSNVTVTATPDNKGLTLFELQVPLFGTMKMYDVHSSTVDGVTVYSAERDVTTFLGIMHTILFARVIDGKMTADVTIPALDMSMSFNTVGDHFQLPNSDMEAWNDNINEPNHWHSFMTAYGS